MLLLKVKEGWRNADGDGTGTPRELSGGFCQGFLGQQGTAVQEKEKNIKSLVQPQDF